MNFINPLSGIIPPLVTPLKDNDTLDIESLERLIEHLIWEDELDNAQKYYEKLLFYNPLFDLSFDEIKSEVNELKKYV